MIGLVFGEPSSRALRVRWKAMEAIRTALFSQLIVVPLFHRHRILTQVAADNMNIVKLLPPLIAGDEEVDYFVEALDDVLGAAARARASSSSSAGRWPRAALRRIRSLTASHRGPPGVRAATSPGPGPRHRGVGLHRFGRDPGPAGPGRPGGGAARARRRPRPTWTASTSSGSRSTCATPTGWPGPSRAAGPSSTWPPSTASGPATPSSSTTSTWAGRCHVMEAARAAGTERLVYTSTVGTLGLDAGQRGPSLRRDLLRRVDHLFGSYKQSKYVAEHEVLRAAAEGLPVSIVLPTFPVGPGDRAPTPTGQLVLDYLNGRIPGYVDTVLNVAHVDDLAAGQILALERGAVGRSYILGGENYSLKQLLDTLAAATGLPRSRLPVPRALALGVARLSELVEGTLLHRHPSVPLEAARMSTTRMAFDDSRARRELGYSPRPAAEALADSARWFVD